MIPTKQCPRVLINLGCGPNAAQTDWNDFDGSWNVLASHLPLGLGLFARQVIGQKNAGFPPHVKYLNVTKKLFFSDRSVDAVYCSHLLEHLHLDEGKFLIREIHRVLKNGGVVRIVVPDTEHYIDAYLAAKHAGIKEACLTLNESLMYRPLVATKSLAKRLYTAVADFHTHKFMYDRSFLQSVLANAGFGPVTETEFGRSLIPEVAQIESAERIGNGYGFGIEGVRI